MDGDAMKRERTAKVQTVLLCLGFGCLLATYSGAPMGSSFLTGWQDSLLLQVTFQTSIAVGCLILGALARRQNITIDPLFGAISYAVIAVLSLVAQDALARPVLGGPSLLSACVLSMVFGLVTSLPLLFWYERLLEVRRMEGRRYCIFLLAVSEFVAVLIFVLLSFLLSVGNNESFPVMVSLVVIAALCQVGSKLLTQKSTPVAPAPSRSRGSYRLTAYSTSMIVCLGAAWGLTCSMFHFAGMTDALDLSPLVTLAIAAIALVSIVLLARLFVNRQFGALVRLTVGMSGIVLSAVPLIYANDPQMFYPFGHFLLIILEISIVFFSIDICFERGLSVSAVMPTNYALFLFVSCAMVFVFWLSQVLVGGQMALEFIALLGAIAVAAVIVFLPSSESNAVAFTLDTLPENDSFENIMAQRRSGIVAKYGLLDREAEVLELLLRGMTRQQIADVLHLSPWTIKDRVSAIYEKTGVHSFKELTRLLEDNE